jgi:hypothetical protein
MSVEHTVAEFRTHWLPHVTDDGLTRLVGLLDTASPLLIHGAFTRACAMGCLATHIAWHHPATRDLNDEAGVCWLTRVAKLNPATSHVILAWDRGGATDWALRTELLRACREELEKREEDSWGDAGFGYNSGGVAPGTRPAACDA